MSKCAKILLFGQAKLAMLSFSLMAGLSSVVVGQRILAIENNAITVSHCQRLNLQNIFFLNQSQQFSVRSELGRPQSVQLPPYCDALLEAKVSSRLRETFADDTNPATREDAIRIYADAFSVIDDHDAELKRNLLIALVAFNVFGLLIESLILYADHKAIESETANIAER